MTGRIRWTDKTAYIAGHVGTLNPAAFQIYRPRKAGQEWILACDLPGAEGVHRSGADEARAKAEAERWLAEFVSSLGAVFPPEPEHRAAVGQMTSGTAAAAKEDQ